MTNLAIDWLLRHPDLATVPGFQSPEDERLWGRGLRYYYWAGYAELLPLLPEEQRPRVARELADQLLSQQSADGFWRNDANAMREDDPLIATGFALMALARIRHCLEPPK